MQTIGNCKNLICVNYPGSVVNLSNAFETLGGIENISEIFCDENRKLQLRFRHHDKLSKSIMGTRKPSTSLLLKIKVKKKTKKICSYSVVATIKEEFHFGAMGDFQYWAMDKDDNIYNQVVPTSLNVDWLKGDGPLLITPGFFSRSDTIMSYYFSLDNTTIDGDTVKVIAKSRRRRFGFAKFMTFDDANVPMEPLEPKEDQKPKIQPELVQKLKEMFDQRPIYSRCAMAVESGVPEVQLKDLAPMVAYHFQNGPWRALWVRFGYDPRTDPQARIYQVLDYRIKGEEQEDLVETKRKKRQQLLGLNSRKTDEDYPDKHVLKPGRLPPSRQFFYQFCDVHLPEVEAILATANLRKECHPNDGWFPEGTSFACRRIIKQYINEVARNRKDAEPDEPTQDASGSEDDEQYSDFDPDLL